MRTGKEKTSPITGLEGKQRLLFFAFCLITAAVPVLYPIVKGHGMFFIEDDFVTQQVPFITYLSGMVKQGIDTWSWDVDLGSSTIQAFTFYELGSPFFWLIALFPQRFAPYLIGPVMLLKYLTACYTAQMFLKRFVKTAWNAVPGALFYAFSGFQETNIVFNHFHDAVALFPLMLVGLELVMDDTDRSARTSHGLFFAMAVFLNAVVNYFFFAQSVIFLIIYYLIRFSVFRHPRQLLHDLPRIMFYALLGGGLAAVVLLPNYYYVLQNARMSNSLLNQSHFYDFRHFMYILKGLLLPGDIMWDETALLHYYWTSTSAYLPFFSFCLVFAYMLKKRDWLFQALSVFIVMSFLPEANSFFLLFTTDYHRWWYGLVMLGALASIQVLQEPEVYPLRKGVTIQAFLIALITAYVFYAKEYDILTESYVPALYHPVRYLFYVALTIPGMLYAWFLEGRKRPLRKPKKGWILLVCISVSAIVTTTYSEYGYKHTRSLKEDDYILMMHVAEDYPAIEPEYRYRNTDNINILFSNSDNTSGIMGYTSTVSPALAEIDKLFDYYSEHLTVHKPDYAGLPELLGARYMIDSGLNYSERFSEWVRISGKELYRYTSNDVECVVKTYPASKIGYRVRNYITEEELRKLPVRYRGVALLYAPCVKDDETGRRCGLEPVSSEMMTEVIEKYPDHAKDDALLVSPVLDELCDRNNAEHVKGFDRDVHGFTAETDYAEDSAVFFSIPADEGWHITIDAEPVDFTDAGGLMLINVPGGEHTIRGEYHCPLFREGCIITGVFAGVYAVLCVFRRKLLI